MKQIREICIYFCFNHIRYAFNRTLIMHVLITSVPLTMSGYFNPVNCVSQNINYPYNFPGEMTDIFLLQFVTNCIRVAQYYRVNVAYSYV